ncbi:MAG: hypothetical protein DRJ62_02215 [Thermoprotei archaeon]|nr:MAG: hypothetical protein DRJ62_02215 [Thermoprotei archaeon]
MRGLTVKRAAPISIIGQSIVHLNQPALSILTGAHKVKVEVNSGVGVDIHGFEWLSAYAKSKITKFLGEEESRIKVEVEKPLPLLDPLIVALDLLAKSKMSSDPLREMSKALNISEERLKLTLRAASKRGVLAYREGEGILEILPEFPWHIALCFKAPLRFRLTAGEDLEEAFNVITHGLGRLVVSTARSILDGDFSRFKRFIETYSKLATSISNTRSNMLSALKKLGSIKGCACKLDEDFKGLLLFGVEGEALEEGLSLAKKMGFKTLMLM